MDEDIIDKQNDHPILNTINLARLRKVSLNNSIMNHMKMAEHSELRPQMHVEYKKQRNLYDFTDMLEMFVKTMTASVQPLSYIS